MRRSRIKRRRGHTDDRRRRIWLNNHRIEMLMFVCLTILPFSAASSILQHSSLSPIGSGKMRYLFSRGGGITNENDDDDDDDDDEGSEERITTTKSAEQVKEDEALDSYIESLISTIETSEVEEENENIEDLYGAAAKKDDVLVGVAAENDGSDLVPLICLAETTTTTTTDNNDETQLQVKEQETPVEPLEDSDVVVAERDFDTTSTSASLAAADEEEEGTDSDNDLKQQDFDNSQGDDEKEEEEEQQEEEDEEASLVRQSSASPSITLPAIKQSSPSSEPSSKPIRVRPPNAMYRFFLRQGRFGHVIVMSLVLWREWVDIYVPLITHAIVWVGSNFLKKLYGSDTADGGDRQYYNERKRRAAASKTSTVSTLSARTGQSSRQRRKHARKADQVALEQLKRLSSVQKVKYRYVSQNFLKRHKLGPYSTGTVSSADTFQDGMLLHSIEIDDDEEEEEASTRKSTAKKAKKRRKKKRPGKDDEEEEEDVDWILNALTKEAPSRSTSGSSKGRKGEVEKLAESVRPTVTVEVGPRGPSVGLGVEFFVGNGKKKKTPSLEEAIRSSSRGGTRQKRRSPSRTSTDRDGGDGVLGRLRSAAGANSMVSRSLFGAYPGDAVPPTEAGSADGVTALAHKYGYGDWSDSEDEENDVYNGFTIDEEKGSVGGGGHAALRRRRSRRRRKRYHRSSSTGGGSKGVSFSSGGGGGSTKKRRRRSSSGGGSIELSFNSRRRDGFDTLQTPRRRSRDPTSTPLRKLTRSSGVDRDGTTIPKDARLVRPATERLSEVRRSRSDRDTASDDARLVRPAMDRLNEVRRRRSEHRDDES